MSAPGETESTRTNYSYDGKLRATGVSKGTSAVGYSYASDLLSAISTASGTDYSFAYGAFDLVQSIQAGSRTLIRHSYSTDGNHQLTRSDYGNGDSVSYGYDSLGRTTSVSYEDGAEVSYAYDNNGNLGLLTDSASGRKTQYFYDFQDRLMRWEQSGSGYENRVTWGYDDNNNLSTQKQTLNGTTYTTSYTYDKDNRLTKTTEGNVSAGYTYDALGRMTALDAQSGGRSVLKTTIGYLLSDGTWAYTWQHGRQLAGMSKSGQTIAYGYDSDGKRITKTVNGTAYNYHYLGDQLVELTWGSNKLHFTYDEIGPASVNCNGAEYFYVRNAQGDVTGLVSASGTRVVTYTYDAWGSPLSTTGSTVATLGAQNPLRYRGYIYDTETGLYYLQSRYYNPGWGRFINADGYASTGQGIIGNNMFAYCGNNPTNCIDRSGKLWKKVGSWFKQAWADVKSFVGHLFGAEVSVVNQVEPRPKE